MSAYFSDAELSCRCGCGLNLFHPGFLDALDALRTDFGEPMVVNSACRCAAHNANVGGHPRSLHIGDQAIRLGQEGALAIDIAAADGHYRGLLFIAAYLKGWSIGWNAKKGFLHLDRRDYVGLKQTTFDY